MMLLILLLLLSKYFAPSILWSSSTFSLSGESCGVAGREVGFVFFCLVDLEVFGCTGGVESADAVVVVVVVVAFGCCVWGAR